MNGVEGIGSAGVTNRVPRVTGTAAGQSTKNREKKPVGLEGALKMAGDFVKHQMAEIGFVDLQGGHIDQIKLFVQHVNTPEPEVETGLDPVTATELAARMGAQIAGDINQALRVMTQVEPERAAALLK